MRLYEVGKILIDLEAIAMMKAPCPSGAWVRTCDGTKVELNCAQYQGLLTAWTTYREEDFPHIENAEGTPNGRLSDERH
jgi:hypothetical protein